MIITRVTGGLGNQMFQYAVGKSLATYYNTSLKIDTSLYEKKGYTSYKYHKRTPKLHQFAIDVPVASWLDFKKFQLLQPFGYQTYYEDGLSFDKRVFQQPSSNIYLRGYWQSEKYFTSVAEELKKDFQLPGGVTGPFNEWQQEIQNKKAIALHVRRGDYVHHPKINAIHGACSAEYYQRAVQKLIDHGVKDAEIFVFSNDMEWCRQELDLPFPINFVEVEEPVDYEELILMSYCSHFVIANSSLSWWAAWLAENPQKNIIAPKKWFKAKHLNSEDIVPESWIRL
jgi:hypothetical protein